MQSGDPQHALFSVFCGVHLSLCYLLSRSAANPALYRGLFANCRRTCHLGQAEGASCVVRSSEASKSEAGAEEEAETAVDPPTGDSAPATEQSSGHSSFDDPLPKQVSY